jgi:hypothetical protein
MDLIKQYINLNQYFEYKYKDNTYYIGEYVNDMKYSLHTINELKQLDQKVIVFNDYFSCNEINGEQIKYMNNIQIEIKPIYDFWNTSINYSFYVEFIVIPADLSKIDILGLCKEYVIDNLKKQYKDYEIEEYIEKINKFDSVNLDQIDFNKIVSINLDLNLIENYNDDSDSIDSGDGEIDITNLDNEDSED